MRKRGPARKKLQAEYEELCAEHRELEFLEEPGFLRYYEFMKRHIDIKIGIILNGDMSDSYKVGAVKVLRNFLDEPLLQLQAIKEEIAEKQRKMDLHDKEMDRYTEK